jgi:hypothetical protein
MGISLGDIASFATGVVDADTAATQERLKDRRAELQADRQLYIDMKTKKYESELKAFEAEDKKYKAIQSVKSQVGDDASKSQFGAAYLQETNPTLLYQMQKDFQDNPKALQDQLALYANANFKTTNTRDALDNKLKTDIDAITAGYKTALENARGDSKLINAILGKRDKEIKLVVEQNKDGETGAVAAKEIATEVDTSNKAYQYGEENEIAFKVPAKFMKDGNVVKLREGLNSNDATKSYKDNAINTTVQFFNDNKVAKPSGFYIKDADNNITGFKDAGAKLNTHVSQLWGGAVDSFSDEKVYIATNRTASNASNILNQGNVNNVIDERLRNYTYIQQPKKWFNDRENIVAIVPWSIVDVNNNLAGFDIKGKANQKLVAEAYADALKDYAKDNNITSQGTIIESNQKFMNDIQSKLLSQKGNESNLSTDIQNRILDKLGVDREKTDNTNINNNTTTINESSTDNKVVGKITITDPTSNTSKVVDDNPENRSLAETKGFTVKTITPIKQTEEKIIDSITNENVTKPIKKTPADFGQVNQPVFETLESIRKVITMPMTGEEIKNTFDISPGLKINSKTLFRPIS